MKTTNLVAVLVMAMLAVSLVAPMIAAQEDMVTDDVIVIAEEELTDEALEDEAGITPASPFYGLERAMERLRVNLVASQEKKAELEIRYANERASEAAVMAQKGNLRGLEKALEVHERNMQRAQEALNSIESNGAEESALNNLEANIRVQERIENHTEKVEAIKARILERQSDKMTEEQLAKVELAFSRAEEKNSEVNANAQQKQENAETKYKALSGKTDEEVDAVVEQARNRVRNTIQEASGEQVQTQNQEQVQAQDSTGEYHDENVVAGGQNGQGAGANTGN